MTQHRGIFPMAHFAARRHRARLAAALPMGAFYARLREVRA